MKLTFHRKDSYEYLYLTNPSHEKVKSILETLNSISNPRVVAKNHVIRISINIDESNEYFLVKYQETNKHSEFYHSRYLVNTNAMDNLDGDEPCVVEFVAPNGEGFYACYKEVHDKVTACNVFLYIFQNGKFPQDTIWERYYY